MRVLFVAAPFASHLYVQVPIAWALRTAGHEVRVAGSPGLQGAIAGTGLTPVPIGEEVDLRSQLSLAEAELSVQSRDPRRPRGVQRDYGGDDPAAELASSIAGCRWLFTPDSAFTDVVELARAWRPDLVVWDTFNYAGAVAAEVTGAASARILFGADGHAQLRSACRARSAGWPGEGADPLREWLGPVLSGHGAGFTERTVLGDWTIFPMPSWIWRPGGVQYVPVRHLPYHGTAPVPGWLSEPPERPRVCVTMGLSHRENNIGIEAPATDLFDAVADLDVEVIATLDARQIERVSRIPDNVRVAGFVPLEALLPTCSAIVHSGGAGTFAAAVRHAVPQLIVPNCYFAEKWWGPISMANGVEEQGAGRYVGDADQMTADGLRKDLRAVLEEPSFADNARRLS
ncbi:MAG TPA: nucleotide disphospho-sugar-binding domain-containing protein, partial [Amycolatopsis sp.]